MRDEGTGDEETRQARHGAGGWKLWPEFAAETFALGESSAYPLPWASPQVSEKKVGQYKKWRISEERSYSRAFGAKLTIERV